MAGFIPDEGETQIGEQHLMNITVDRGTDLELGLFTNVSPGETITEAAITEPSGGGYARINLTDGNWSQGLPGVYSYAQQTFTAVGGPMTGTIQGYFICTKGTTKRLIAVEVDPNGPYTLAQGDTYRITPQITYKDSGD